MTAQMIQVQTIIVPPLHTCTTPPPPASSPATLYELLSGDGRSRVDVNRHFTLDGEIHDKWISALRSGRYSQHYGYWHYRDSVDRVCTVEVILHELGYEDSGPREPLIAKVGLDLCKEVIALNDRLHWSFERIATWLETQTKPVSWVERCRFRC